MFGFKDEAVSVFWIFFYCCHFEQCLSNAAGKKASFAVFSPCANTLEGFRGVDPETLVVE